MRRSCGWEPRPHKLGAAGRYSQIVRSCRSSPSWHSRRPPGWGWLAAAAAPARPGREPRGAVKARQWRGLSNLPRGRGWWQSRCLRAHRARNTNFQMGSGHASLGLARVTREQPSHQAFGNLHWFELPSQDRPASVPRKGRWVALPTLGSLGRRPRPTVEDASGSST